MIARLRRRRLERQRRAVGSNGWTCHVCGEYRPDALISVYQRRGRMNGVPITENVRYCNDRPACRAGVEHVSWLPPVLSA